MFTICEVQNGIFRNAAYLTHPGWIGFKFNRQYINCSFSITYVIQLLFTFCPDQNSRSQFHSANPRNFGFLVLILARKENNTRLPQKGSGLSLHPAFHGSSDSNLCVSGVDPGS